MKSKIKTTAFVKKYPVLTARVIDEINKAGGAFEIKPQALSEIAERYNLTIVRVAAIMHRLRRDEIYKREVR